MLEAVYPACAGIDRSAPHRDHGAVRLPRMRGDRPFSRRGIDSWRKFTPHARGSTQELTDTELEEFVYPACAGIDLHILVFLLYVVRLPRMRGDRPVSSGPQPLPYPFTPHARGSTVRWFLLYPAMRVYPACAGIDPV